MAAQNTIKNTSQNADVRTTFLTPNLAAPVNGMILTLVARAPYPLLLRRANQQHSTGASTLNITVAINGVAVSFPASGLGVLPSTTSSLGTNHVPDGDEIGYTIPVSGKLTIAFSGVTGGPTNWFGQFVVERKQVDS